MAKQKKHSKQRHTTKKRGGAAGRFSRFPHVAKTVLNGLFGKTGFERIDKAKDVGETILKQMEKANLHEQPQSDNQKKTRMYKTFLNNNTNTNSPHHADIIRVGPVRRTFTVKTPTTPTPTSRGSRSRSEPKLPKTLRHMTRSTRVPAAYAPTLDNVGANPIKNLESEFDLLNKFNK